MLTVIGVLENVVACSLSENTCRSLRTCAVEDGEMSGINFPPLLRKENTLGGTCTCGAKLWILMKAERLRISAQDNLESLDRV